MPSPGLSGAPLSCRHPRPGRARPRMGLSPSRSRARLRSPSHPSSFPRSGLGARRLLRPPSPALPSASPSPPAFSLSSPFSRERDPFACAPAPVPYSCGGSSCGGPGSSKRRGGAATLSTPRPPRPFPPPPQPHFRDRSRRVTGTAPSGYHWLQRSRGPAQSREARPGNPTCCGLMHFRREEHFLECGCGG